MYQKLLATTFTLLFISGCAGVKFSPAPVNQPLPEAFSKRALYPAGVAGYKFEGLVGNILLIESEKDPLPIGVIRPTAYKNEVTLITDPNNFYQSRIQLGAEAQGSYLAFAAKFAADEMAELTLLDSAYAGINFDSEATWDEIQKKIVSWVKDHPKTNANSKRLWVKAAVLSRRLYQGHTKIDANASGQVGDVAGVKTGVYRKNDEVNRSVEIGFEAFDVDALAGQAGKPAAPGLMSLSSTMSRSFLLDISRYTGVINGTIKNGSDQ